MRPVMVIREPTQSAAGWDEELAGWPSASLLQSYSWGEVQARAGWRTHRCLVRTSSGQLPLTVLAASVGVGAVRRLYVPRGPALAADDLDGFAAVESRLRRLGRQLRAWSVELEVPWEAQQIPAHHPWLSWRQARSRQPRATVVVDVRPDDATILASFHSKTRYNIRLAQRREVSVSVAGLAELLPAIQATEARQHIHLPQRRHLEVVLDRLAGSSCVLAARVEGEVVAALLLVWFGGQAIYLYGGATGRHKERMPNYLLHWEAIRRARELGCHSYDLWGVPETDAPDHPWHGLAQFKLGFGGRRILLAGSRAMDLRPLGGAVVSAVDGVRRLARSGRRG